MSVTTIEWTQRPGTVGETWNPTTGCNKVDRGCKNCYAETMHRRLQAMGQAKYEKDFLDGAVPQPDTLYLPLRWSDKKPRTVFVNSMSDLFHKDIPFEFIHQVFGTMEAAHAHTFLILTKRPERALEFWDWMSATHKTDLFGNVIPSNEPWRCPGNVWIGTSIHDQNSANIRIPFLLKLKNCMRFLSYEPATGKANLRRVNLGEWSLDEDGNTQQRNEYDVLAGEISVWYWRKGQEFWHREEVHRDQPRLHWVIMGGESGPKADPMHPAWVRIVRTQCQQTGTPFFFKQWGTWRPITYRRENQEIYIKFELGKNERLLDQPLQNMVRVGKGAAGHELDGETWQQFPDQKLPE
jgi:protein gp37